MISRKVLEGIPSGALVGRASSQLLQEVGGFFMSLLKGRNRAVKRAEYFHSEALLLHWELEQEVKSFVFGAVVPLCPRACDRGSPWL